MTLELQARQARQGRPGRDRQAQPDLRGRQVLPGRLGLPGRDRLARLGPQAALVQRVRPGLRDQPATPGLPGLQAQPETRALRVRRGQLARPAQRPLLQAPLGLQAKLDLPVLPGLRDRRAFRAMWAQPDLQGQRGRRLRLRVRPDLLATRALPGLRAPPDLRVRPQLLLAQQVQPGQQVRLDQLALRLTSLARLARLVRRERLALASLTRAPFPPTPISPATHPHMEAARATHTSLQMIVICGCGMVRHGLIMGP